MESLRIFNVALRREARARRAARCRADETNQDDTLKAVWSEATQIKNVALTLAKVIATHQLSSSPNL